MGFEKPILFETNRYHIVFFERILARGRDYYTSGQSAVLLDGMVVYRQQDTAASLKTILEDHIQNRLQTGELTGQFTLILIHNDQVEIIRDATGVASVFTLDNYVFASSFLSLCEIAPRLTVNRNALIENMLSGALVGPDTLFSEIKRMEKDGTFPGLRFQNLCRPEYSLKSANRNKLITGQLDELDAYFYALRPMVEKQGLTIGLTGGFDSRLLMALAERHYSNIHYFTHWRKTLTKEVVVAKALSKFANRPLTMHSVTPPLEMTEIQAKDNLEKAFYHCDGQIRTQLYWHEAYNTLDYIKEIYQQTGLGFHGIGGEQYRNYERMIRPYWSFDAWLKNDILYRYSNNVFKSKKHEKTFYKWYSNKIQARLGIGEKKYVKRIHVKRYHNEVYNQSNRAVRLTLENKAVFFTGPFIESRVSTRAYEAAPYLGMGLDFQAALIHKLNPKLAAIESDYGYNFSEGESLKSKIMGSAKEIMPKKQFYQLYHQIRKTRNDSFYAAYVNTFPFMKKIDTHLNEVLPALDLNQLKQCRDTGWQLIALGYLLDQFSHKVTTQNE
ncbi:hypothetical protein [Salinivirga cyanobacteriivorans]|nr:hypothetical protein [Salinivirga cyanobacteriivorans]